MNPVRDWFKGSPSGLVLDLEPGRHEQTDAADTLRWGREKAFFDFRAGQPAAPLDGYVYPDTDLVPFHGPPHGAVVTGHAHRPFDRPSGGKVFVNAGSVGLPRDRCALAAFARYDAGADRFAIVRVPLDVPAILAACGDRTAEVVRACLLRR